MTFLAALRRDRIDAPWLIDGPINGERFRHYVEEVFVPTLRPGDIVILETSAATRGAGASPRDPRRRRFLRKAAERSFDAVCNRIAQLFDAFTPQQCENYFVNSGYKPT
jgi:putative transposase